MTQRGDGLFLQEKLILNNIKIPTGQNFVKLSKNNNEVPSENMSIGPVNEFNNKLNFGVVVAQMDRKVGVHSNNMVPGITLSPSNLVTIRDAVTKAKITASANGWEIYGLLQVGINAINGSNFDGGKNKLQISFVNQTPSNTSGLTFEATAISDIQNKIINYKYLVRLSRSYMDSSDSLMPIFQEPYVDSNNISSISSTDHETLRQLIHLADGGGPFEGFASGAYRETLPLNNPFPTSVIWWASSSKLIKIVEKLISYDGNKRISTITWTSYDSSNVLLATVLDTFSYSGSSPFEKSRTRTVS